MWKKLAPLLIVLSAALNIAFAGVWVFHAFDSRAIPSQEVEYKGKVWCPLHRQLDVSDDQWQKIEPGLVEFKRVSKKLRYEIGLDRAKVIDMVASTNPDRLAIQAWQDEIRDRQRQIQQLIVDRLLAEKEFLTPAQQKMFFDMLRKSSGCKGIGNMIGTGKSGSSLCDGNKKNSAE